MGTLAITAATGHLGRLVVDRLLADGVPAGQIVAIARTPQKAADLAAKGVEVREGDYARPDTLPAALAGVDTLLLISGLDMGQRVQQHTTVIEAAKAAGVTRIVYTSAPKADHTELPIAVEHLGTEQVLRASGVPFTILRNSWYIENYTAHLPAYLATGEIVGAAGDGRIAGATRADFAAAAVATLTGEGHDNQVYELGGPSFTLAALADAVTEATGTKVVYRDITEAELAQLLRQAGLADAHADVFAAVDTAIAGGALDNDGGDLSRLIGRPATPLLEAVRSSL